MRVADVSGGGTKCCGGNMSFLSEIEILIIDNLKQVVDADLAKATSRKIIKAMQLELGGSPFYVSKRNSNHAEIKAAFTGKNHKQLAHDYGYCTQQIRRIVEKPAVIDIVSN